MTISVNNTDHQMEPSVLIIFDRSQGWAICTWGGHEPFPSKFPSKYLSDRQPSNGWAELSRAEQQSANGWAMLSKAHAQQTNHWARIGIRHLAVWAVIQKYWWPLMNDWTVFFTLRYVWYNYVLSNEWNSIYLWIICLIFKVLHDNISC